MFAKYYKYCFQLQALIITNKMLLLWITFNSSDLQYPIVFLLASVSLLVSDRAALAFKTAITIMNPVAIAIFFDKTYKAIFDHFFAIRSNKNRLF